MIRDPAAILASVKTATKQALDLVGGIDAAASCSRVGRSQLSEYSNRNSVQVVPIDIAIGLDQYAQQPLILAAMARVEGYTLLAIELGEGDVAVSMERIARGAGELLATTVRVLSDGVVSAAEAAELTHGLSDLNRVIHQALGVLHALQHPAPSAIPLRSSGNAA